ncbi:lipase family alpha/beta hydrolase [Aquirhabdus sp.]|uniref:lipase family alpha/beta hydrolase n=1 Tax=Aquirhabdus sp. TaxID=2824160 RepID=UPI00396C8BC3
MKHTASLLMLVGSVFPVSLTHATTTSTYQYCSYSDGLSSCRDGNTEHVSSKYAQTKYPIVLAHGLSGWSSIGGFEYFYGISSDLTENGAQVFDTQVAAAESSYVRGEQLLNQIQEILAITGSKRVNLVGHSQGVLDGRYVAAVIPNQVASLTGVAGVNLGSPVADRVLDVMDAPVIGGFTKPIIGGVLNTFFSLIGISSGQAYSQSSYAAVKQLSTAGMTAYNKNFPQGMSTSKCGEGDQQVKSPDGTSTTNYYSWGGTGIITNPLDVLSYAFLVTSPLISGSSDGLVPRCSSHLGKVIRDNYNQNHMNEVNQIMGMVDVFSVSPVVLYRQQANRLKLAGM